MKIVLALLLVQGMLGAYDSLWHHEITARLPQRRSARRELLRYSARAFLYALIVLGLAWREWRGAWVWLLAGLLVSMALLTFADWLAPVRTRALPAAERRLHAVLAVNCALWLGLCVSHGVAWSLQPTALAPVAYGGMSIALTLAAAAALAWALRTLSAGLRQLRAPAWVRQPLTVGAREVPRTYLVTGATGFIGSALVRELLARGDAVIVLTRSPDTALELFGPHVRIVGSLEAIEAEARIEGIVNLAGAPILALPWVSARRRVLLGSRLRTTQAVLALCRRLQTPPQVLVSGSAIGYYGTRGDEECDETALPQAQFQSELCRQWEAQAAQAQPLGVRVVLLRTGLVLGRRGGALPLMARPVRLWAGGILGSGRQWVSWIHLADMIRIIVFALDHPAVHGALNATAPAPVRHRQFQHSLAQQLHRPLWTRMPAGLLRLMLGEMAELLTAGQRVLPRGLEAHGFQFRYPDLPGALAALFPVQAPGRAGGAEDSLR